MSSPDKESASDHQFEPVDEAMEPPVTQAVYPSPTTWSDHQQQTEETEYRYSLLTHRDEIRLFQIFPRRDEAHDIRCRLTTHRLNENLKYEALSYVWGDPQPQKSIICDGLRFSVNPNLYAALEQLVDKEHERTIWIDAICINQTDLDERAQQVALMGRLFAGATHVVVWGGPDQDDLAADAFEIIQQTVDFYDDRFEKNDRLDLTVLFPPVLSSPLFSRVGWTPIINLYELPCFHRVWCMQEIGLARKATLQWGDKSITWSILVEFVMLRGYFRLFFDERSLQASLQNLYNRFVSLWSTFPTPGSKSWINERPFLRYVQQRTASGPESKSLSNETTQGEDALRVLLASRSLEASIPHDYVYGFLGHTAVRLCFVDGNPHVKPDYASHLSVVYTQVATRILHSMRTLTIFSAVGHTDSTFSDIRFPSWCPRWDDKWFPAPLGVPSSNGTRPFYSTNGRPEMWDKVLDSSLAGQSFRVVGKVIKTQALIFDHMTWAHERVDASEWNRATAVPDQGQGTAFRNPVQTLWEPVVGGSPRRKAPYDDSAQALCYTLHAGQNLHSWGEADISIIGPRFHAFLRQKCGFQSAELEQFDLHRGPDGMDQSGEYFHDRATSLLANRRVALTSKGYMGLSPLVTEPGDICCVLPAATVPFILRSVNSNQYKLVGECYIHGIMHGEALDMYQAGELELQEIDII